MVRKLETIVGSGSELVSQLIIISLADFKLIAAVSKTVTKL